MGKENIKLELERLKNKTRKTKNYLEDMSEKGCKGSGLAN